MAEDLIFNQESIIVESWAMGIERGEQRVDQVPDVSNLQEQVRLYMDARRKFYKEQLGLPYPPDKEEPKEAE